MFDDILFLANEQTQKFSNREKYSFESPTLARKGLQMMGDGDGDGKGIDFSVTNDNDLQAHGPIQYCNICPLSSALMLSNHGYSFYSDQAFVPSLYLYALSHQISDRLPT